MQIDHLVNVIRQQPFPNCRLAAENDQTALLNRSGKSEIALTVIRDEAEILHTEVVGESRFCRKCSQCLEVAQIAFSISE